MTDAEQEIIRLLKDILEIVSESRPRRAFEVQLKNKILNEIQNNIMQGHEREDHKKKPRRIGNG